MKTPDQIIQEYAETYSEYGEMLGVYYQPFLMYKIAADLAKAQDKIEYYKKWEQTCYSRK